MWLLKIKSHIVGLAHQTTRLVHKKFTNVAQNIDEGNFVGPKQGKADCNRRQKASSTRMASQAVPHPSTDRALRRLTSEFGRDPVYSSRYGR